MAFCPECGKAAAAEATRCIYCGYDFPEAVKPAGGGRFKGTMMMQAPVAVAPKPAAQPAPQAAAPAPQVAAPAPQAAAPAPQVAAPAAVVPKAALKGTMVGGAMGQLHAAPGGDPQKPALAFAATQPQQQAFTLPTQGAAAARTDESQGKLSLNTERKKYLPGDPMAPGGGATHAHHAPRDVADVQSYDEDSAPTPKAQPQWMWMAVAGIVVVGLIAAVALFMKMGH